MTQTDHTTLADTFFNDPRVQAARRQIIEAMAEHQAKLTGVRPPNPELKAEYDKTLERFGELRAGKLVYPFLGSGIGRGPLVELADGSVKYDLIGGIGVHYFGHGHPDLVAAGFDAALGDTIMQGNLQQNTESVEVSQRLVDLATRHGSGLKHCFLTTSGAMANENGLKLLLHHKSPANRLLAFEGCFSGRTLLLSQLTDKAAYRPGLPDALPVDYLPFYDAQRPEESTKQTLAVLERHLSRYPGRHAAMVFELVLGEGGYYPGSKEFFTAIMQRLKEAGVGVMVDEIQSFGRTSKPFAFQHYGLDELVDVVSIGKMSQLCATLFTDAYAPPAGLISQTFTGSTSAILAARTILRTLEEGDLFGAGGRIAQLSKRCVGRLEKIASEHPGRVAGPFGEGAMIAFTPFDGKPETAKQLLRSLYDAGVIAFVCGASPARIRFLLPVANISEEELDDAMDIVEKVLAQTAASRQ